MKERKASGGMASLFLSRKSGNSLGRTAKVLTVKYASATLLFLLCLPLSLRANCFNYAAEKFHVDVDIIRAIALVESNFNHQAFNVNKNKSYDIGMMQINSIHRTTLAKAGIKMEDLLESCTNIIVGTWILKGSIERAGGDTWKGVGYYHSLKPKFYNPYIGKVRKAYSKILSEQKTNN